LARLDALLVVDHLLALRIDLPLLLRATLALLLGELRALLEPCAHYFVAPNAIAVGGRLAHLLRAQLGVAPALGIEATDRCEVDLGARGRHAMAAQVVVARSRDPRPIAVAMEAMHGPRALDVRAVIAHDVVAMDVTRR
jgi:hypothetical protein